MENENTVVVTMMAESKRAIEAILLVSSDPTPTQLLAQLLEMPVDAVEEQCRELAMAYDLANHGFQLVEVAGGWRYQTHPDLAPYVERFAIDGQSTRLSTAALETLAIVAYKQPMSRAQVSAIRGVNVDAVLRTLVQRGYVEEVGRDVGAGQAVLFGTTQYFLERVGLNKTSDLPALGDFVPSAEVVEALEQTLKVGVATDEIELEVEVEVEERPEASTNPGVEVATDSANGSTVGSTETNGTGAEAVDQTPTTEDATLVETDESTEVDGPADQVEAAEGPIEAAVVTDGLDGEVAAVSADIGPSEDADEPAESVIGIVGFALPNGDGLPETPDGAFVQVEVDGLTDAPEVSNDEVEVVSEVAPRSGVIFTAEPAASPVVASDDDLGDIGLSADFLGAALARTLGFDDETDAPEAPVSPIDVYESTEQLEAVELVPEVGDTVDAAEVHVEADQKADIEPEVLAGGDEISTEIAEIIDLDAQADDSTTGTTVEENTGSGREVSGRAYDDH